jgi:hypothetical protein
MNTHEYSIGQHGEYLVDANTIGRRLALTRRQVLQMARAGKIPSHTVGLGKKRKLFRFMWSEVKASILNKKSKL